MYEGTSHSYSLVGPLPSPAKARVICVRISPNEVYKFPLRQSQRFDSSEQEIDDEVRFAR